MKNIKLLTLSIVLIAKLSYGQDNTQPGKPKDPLFVVITSAADTLKGRKALIEPSEFKSIQVIQNVEAMKKYGAEGESSVVEIKLNPGAKIFDFIAFKRFYNITQFKSIHISVDGSAVIPATLLVTKRAIKDLKKNIVKENDEINIEIITGQPKKKFQPGQKPVTRGQIE